MIDIKQKIPLREMTTFQIGGPAAHYVTVSTEEELKEALTWARDHNTPFYILGGGSNVLVADSGFEGLVIKMAMLGLTVKDTTLTIEAGCVLKDVIFSSAEHGLGGWEKLAGIPGTVGGAVRGNAGAFGTEMKDVVKSVRAMNTGSLEIREFSLAECDFAYRHSYFKDTPGWIITSTTIELSHIDPQESRRVTEETIAEREKRHLQNVRAAGSFFMNPIAPENVVRQFEEEKNTIARESRVPAGWLIEKVGMKGKCVGGACASTQHPNYLVNDSGTATAQDIITLASMIKSAVKEQFGVELTEEVSMV